MVADRIKALREENHMTQSDLARKPSITRASVNAGEIENFQGHWLDAVAEKLAE